MRYGYDGWPLAPRAEHAATGDDTRFEHRFRHALWSVTDAMAVPRTFVWDRHGARGVRGPVTTMALDSYLRHLLSGNPVALSTRRGGDDLPATPYAEDRPAAHPALWFHRRRARRLCN